MKEEFSCKIHKSGNDVILAVADAEIVGKRFSDGKTDIIVSHEFYSEEQAGAPEVLALVKSATSVNAIGERIVGLFLKNGLVKKKETVCIGGLPHAQIFRI